MLHFFLCCFDVFIVVFLLNWCCHFLLFNFVVCFAALFPLLLLIVCCCGFVLLYVGILLGVALFCCVVFPSVVAFFA